MIVKITKSQLKKIIKEEIQKQLKEEDDMEQEVLSSDEESYLQNKLMELFGDAADQQIHPKLVAEYVKSFVDILASHLS